MTKDTANMAMRPNLFMLAEEPAYLVISGTGDPRLQSKYQNASIAAPILKDAQLKEKAVLVRQETREPQNPISQEALALPPAQYPCT
jgi:hypothetical protein